MSAKKRSAQPSIAEPVGGSRYTSCPVCGKTVAIPLVNQHLNLCLTTSSDTAAAHFNSPSKVDNIKNAKSVGAHKELENVKSAKNVRSSDSAQTAKDLSPPAAKRQKTEGPTERVVEQSQKLVEEGCVHGTPETWAGSLKVELGEGGASEEKPSGQIHHLSDSPSEPPHCSKGEKREEDGSAQAEVQAEGACNQQAAVNNGHCHSETVGLASILESQSSRLFEERSGVTQGETSGALLLPSLAEESLKIQVGGDSGASPKKLSGHASTHEQKKGLEVESLDSIAPIFKKPNKIIYLIRHGNTTHNSAAAFQPFNVQEELHAPTHDASSSVAARTDSSGRIFDVPLSPLGLKQAAALRPKLPGMRADVILVSPLTRALQTCQEALGDLKVPIEVTSRHAEHVACCGDVGRPPAILSKEFPQFDLSRLPSVWWYCPSEAPNHALSGTFLSRESMSHLRDRVQRFRAYLQQRPERTIIVIGHSTFFRELLGEKRRMAHCEVVQLRL